MTLITNNGNVRLDASIALTGDQTSSLGCAGIPLTYGTLIIGANALQITWVNQRNAVAPLQELNRFFRS